MGFYDTGKRKSSFGHVWMRKSFAVGPSGWKVYERQQADGKLDLLLKIQGGLFSKRRTVEWKDAQGATIAREAMQQTQGGSGAREGYRPVLDIVTPLDEKMIDLVVTVWCTRIWQENRAANHEHRTFKERKSLPFIECHFVDINYAWLSNCLSLFLLFLLPV